MKVRLLVGLFFFQVTFLGYVIPGHSALTSGIDAQFKLRQKNSQKTILPSSPGVGFYQKVLSSTLGSSCQYFPSDSSYAQIIAKRCGPLKATLKSFARFSREPDAAYLGIPSFVHNENIHFEDIPDDCDWLD